VPDELNLSMFRAYDIRTPSAHLTPELAARLARAEAVYFRDVLQTSGVVLAHDARATGPKYLTIATEVFRCSGLEVVYIPGVTSTSAFYYAAMCHPTLAAVMVGASHNPAGDTGQKILGPGVAPIARAIGPEGGLVKIQELYEAGASCPSPRRGPISACDLTDDYIGYSMELAGVETGGLRGLKIFHDYLFGAAGREMLLAFTRTGAELSPLHFAADGAFPLGDPNPVKQAVIRAGIDTLRTGDFLLGMFFDGDGDRIDIYRGDASYLSSSFVYAAILPEIRRRFHGAGLGVFADLKCNPLAIIEMAHSGVTVDVIRNGHSQIKQSLIDDEARLGAVEESAHFYEAFEPPGGGRFCTENTLYFALLVARVWSEDPGRFERLFEIQRSTAREREWGYKFPTDAQRGDALRAVQRHFEAKGARSLQRMKNGMDLEATLMRRGLPFDVDQNTVLTGDWIQICQRVSQSENGLARWEAVGATPELVRQAKQEVAACGAGCGAGEEYQG
jgi:phosphomannomutase